MTGDDMRLLADHIASAASSRVPASVAVQARLHILDTLAAVVSGSGLDAGLKGADYARVEGGTGRSTILGTGEQTSATLAAFANGMAAHADETDDSHPGSLSHPGCSIVPAALALAEARGSTGTQLLNAVIAGYDAGPRVVAALGPALSPGIMSGYSTHSYVGQFGSAAAACVLHGFDERQVRHTLSYAAQSVGGTTTWTRDRAHVEKAFTFAGMPAANGIRAAAMVSVGGEGVDDVFGGEPSFLRALSSDPRPGQLSHGLGSRFEIAHTNIKKYAVGSPAQAAVQATEDLIASDDPRVEDIVAIEIKLPSDLAWVVDRSDMPDVNVRFLVAGTLVDRGFSFAMAHDSSRLSEPGVMALLERTVVTADPVLTGTRAGTVTLTVRGGRTLRRHVPAVRGTVDLPMTADEVVTKATDLFAPTTGDRRAARIVDLVLELDSLRSLDPLIEALHPHHTASHPCTDRRSQPLNRI